MGFADEVKQTQETKAFTADKGAEEAAPEEIFNQGLPSGNDPVNEEVRNVPVEPAPAAKIRIGTKEFATPDDAYKYAQELEIARAQDQGFIEGIKSAKPEAEVPAEKSIDEQVEEIIFEDPKKAIKLLRESIKKELEQSTDTKITAKEKQIEAQATLRQEWNNFYDSNKDLVGQQDYVNYILQTNYAELGPLPTAKAFPILAAKVRTGLKAYRDGSGNETELPAGPARVASGSGTSPVKVAVDAPEENKLDFITQIKKHGRRA